PGRRSPSPRSRAGRRGPLPAPTPPSGRAGPAHAAGRRTAPAAGPPPRPRARPRSSTPEARTRREASPGTPRRPPAARHRGPPPHGSAAHAAPHPWPLPQAYAAQDPLPGRPVAHRSPPPTPRPAPRLPAARRSRGRPRPLRPPGPALPPPQRRRRPPGPPAPARRFWPPVPQHHPPRPLSAAPTRPAAAPATPTSAPPCAPPRTPRERGPPRPGPARTRLRGRRRTPNGAGSGLTLAPNARNVCARPPAAAAPRWCFAMRHPLHSARRLASFTTVLPFAGGSRPARLPGQTRSFSCMGQPRTRSLLRWLYLGRITVAAGLFAGTLLVWAETAPATTRLVTLLLLAALAVTAGSVWHTHVRGREPRRGFLYGQVAFDTLLVTVAVYLTGGVESDLAPLYILVIAAGALLLPLPGGVLIGLLASALFVGQ